MTRSGVPSPSEFVAKNARLQGRVEAELGESEGGDIDITSRKEAEAELQLRERRQSFRSSRRRSRSWP